MRLRSSLMKVRQSIAPWLSVSTRRGASRSRTRSVHWCTPRRASLQSDDDAVDANVELDTVTLPRGLASRFQLVSRFGGGGLGELFRVRAKATHAELALRLTIFKSAPEIVTALNGL